MTSSVDSSSDPLMGEVMDSHELKNIVEATALDLDRGHSSCDINGETLDGSTGHDRQDMARLGRKQELGRVFKTVSLLSFAAVSQATWEFAIASMGQGLYDGGSAGLVWTYVWVFLGFLPIVASIAEMASMAPTSGGQYHWVSEFAPRKYQKILSYIAGWQAVLGWQANNASGPLLTGTIIQSLISENNTNYTAPSWQGTLLVISNVLILGALNIWGNSLIAKATNGAMALHVALFIAIITALWAVAPKSSAAFVFTEFSNLGGYSPTSLSLMVGQLSAVLGLAGFDSGAHLSEEVSDSSRSVPIATMGSFLINGIMGFVITLTFVFCMPSVQDCLNDPSGYPFIYVFNQAFSVSVVNALSALLVILIFASNVGYNLATSRELYAFARDGGTPFAIWVSHVHPNLHLPVNSILITCSFSILMSLIYIGSSEAFFAVSSLGTVALFLTYSISISCVLWRRLFHPSTLPPARWSLGRAGPAVNAAGIVFSWWTCFWAFWPETVPVDAGDFNYAVLMFGATNLLAAGVYVTARKTYKGPVVLVRGRAERDD